MSEEKQLVSLIIDLILQLLLKGESPAKIMSFLIKDYYFQATVEAVEGEKVIVGGGREATVLNNGRFSPGDEAMILNTGKRLFAYYPVRRGTLPDLLSDVVKTVEVPFRVICMGFTPIDPPQTFVFTDAEGGLKERPITWETHAFGSMRDILSLTAHDADLIIRAPKLSSYIKNDVIGTALYIVDWNLLYEQLNMRYNIFRSISTDIKLLYYGYSQDHSVELLEAYTPAVAAINEAFENTFFYKHRPSFDWDNPPQTPANNSVFYAGIVDKWLADLNASLRNLDSVIKAVVVALPELEVVRQTQAANFLSTYPMPWRTRTSPTGAWITAPNDLLTNPIYWEGPYEGTPWLNYRYLDANNNIVEPGNFPFLLTSTPKAVIRMAEKDTTLYWKRIAPESSEDSGNWPLTERLLNDLPKTHEDIEIPKLYAGYNPEGGYVFSHFDEEAIKLDLDYVDRHNLIQKNVKPPRPQYVTILALPETDLDPNDMLTAIHYSKLPELYNRFIQPLLNKLAGFSTHRTLQNNAFEGTSEEMLNILNDVFR